MGMHIGLSCRLGMHLGHAQALYMHMQWVCVSASQGPTNLNDLLAQATVHGLFVSWDVVHFGP